MDVQKFQTLLQEKKVKLQERLESLTEDKTRKDGPVDPDFEEQAVMLQNNEVVDHLDAIERKELNDINNALQRIENKTFGICIECGEEIGGKRLEALPTTTLCMNCLE